MTDLGWPMLSMVNANRFINMGAIPLVLVAYAIFIWIDHARATRARYEQDPDIELHMQNVENSRSLDALVFGGSNAAYSLSAEYLSYHTRLNWYNASLGGELLWLGHIKEYENFVLKLSARIDRAKVRYVVYSSSFPYLMGAITEWQGRVNGEGIKPSGSVLGHIVQYISGRLRQVSPHSEDSSLVSQRLRNSFGDIAFERLKCKFTESPEHQREKEDVSADFLVDKAIFFASVFPNASILIVLPSEYYGVSFDDSIFEQNLRKKFYGLLHQKYHFDGIVKIIFQPPYSSITQVCDFQSHANEDGRVWRTQNLIESIQSTISRHRAFLHGQVNHL
jgi:hypothetical protein